MCFYYNLCQIFQTNTVIYKQLNLLEINQQLFPTPKIDTRNFELIININMTDIQ